MARKRSNALPPSSYYDPALTATREASSRGLSDLLIDTERDRGYNDADWAAAQGQIAQGRTRAGEDYDEQNEDVNRSSGRSLSDLVLAKTRGQEDYTRNLSGLQRNYDRVRDAQRQQQAQAGVQRGGAAAQAAAKRGANQAWEKTDIDTAKGRSDVDIDTQSQRVAEDRDESLSDIVRNRTRTGQDYDVQSLQANQSRDRSNELLGTTASRAGREDTALGIATAQQKVNQAIQNNWKPPAPPKPKKKGGKK